MDLKLVLFFIAFAHVTVAALRRNPRVYNALITTDQNLTPSRTYPVIQPHIEYPVLSYGSGPSGLDPSTWLNPYNPYYNPYYGSEYPLELGEPHPLPFDNRHFAGHQQPTAQQQPSSNNAANNEANSDTDNSEDESGANNDDATDDKSASNNQPDDSKSNNAEQNPGDSNNNPTNQKPPPRQSHNTQYQPLPLNEFGLPPNLVPINPLYNSWNLQRRPDPVNLSPYPYHSYPLIYEGGPSYQPSPFLPPYGLFTPELRRPQPTNPAPADKKRNNNSGQRRKQSPKSKEKTDNSSSNEKEQKPEEDTNKNKDDQSTPTGQQMDQEDASQMDQQQNQKSDQQQTMKSQKLQQPERFGNGDGASVKNFNPINRNVPDVAPPPPPSGAKDAMA